MTTESRPCFVYKGDRKDDHYLYLPHEITESTPPEDVPPVVLNLLGELSLVIEFELSVDRHLAQADVKQVLADIEAQGFYLQMPKRDMLAEEAAYFN
ncbi:YcgL domain-containing protein [Arenicella chitinivorans]|uniref:YcgL domain-containing protein n=1 Tax=Arenicella chitinivorans TaxID=1329800 RepID=A0A918RNT3_9GAMM|nr:YcgL domain-containing protein [Arenicella chitinivorans]GHA07154.1 YcgL domain-containing protein [Arenicella chitinivorans]